MKIDAAVQTVRIEEGHVLSFRLDESMWPEYIPPPQVQAWLRFAYGIERSFYMSCPSMAFTRILDNPRSGPEIINCPPSVLVHTKKLRKFWWLDVLRSPPDIARLGGGGGGPISTSPPRPSGRRDPQSDGRFTVRARGR